MKWGGRSVTDLAEIPASGREGIDRGDQSVILFQSVKWSKVASTSYKRKLIKRV